MIHKYEDKEFIFIDNNTKKLLVSFGTHNGDYFKLNSLKHRIEYSYLFFTNKNNWYLDNNAGETYQEILRKYIDRFGKENVTFFGSSMGGYGALYHGLKLDTNIITNNPQINREITLAHDVAEKDNYCVSLSKLNSLPCLSLIYNKKQNNIKSVIYYIVGNGSVDLMNYVYFNSIMPNSIKVISEKVNNVNHDYYLHDIDDFFKRIEILSNIRNTKITYDRS